MRGRATALLLAVLLLALATRLVFTVAVVGLNAYGGGDEPDYHRHAAALAAGQGFVNDAGEPTATRPPLYPVVLAAFYRVFGAEQAVGRILQIALGVVLVLLIYAVAARLFTRRVGLIAAGLAAVNPSLIYLSGLLMTENLAIVLILVMLLALAKEHTEERATAARFAAGGLLAGLSCLARPDTLPFALLVPASALVFGRARVGRRLLNAAVFVVVTALTILPWAARNRAALGEWVLFTTHGGITFYESNNIRILEDPSFHGSVVLPRTSVPGWNELESLGEVELDRRAWGMGREFVREHPELLPRMLAWKFARFWRFRSNLKVSGTEGAMQPAEGRSLGEVARNVDVGWVYSVVVVPLFLLGLAVTARKWRSLLLLYGVVVANVLVALAFHGSMRARSPVEPVMAVFAAATAALALKKANVKRCPAAPLALILVLAAAPALAAPVRVEFRFEHPEASIVNLAGTFNGWCNAGPGGIDTGIDPMDGPDGEGWWTLEKLLEPNYYEYKFVADGGTWFTDPLNARFNPAEYNNSILEVHDPLVYYLLPKSGAVTGGATPTIMANLGKSDGRTFNLNQLRIRIDGALVASGPSWYDPQTGRASYTPGTALANGSHTARVRVALTNGWSHADSTTFTVEADAMPPVITHTPPGAVAANAPVVVACEITDDVGVREAALSYRGGPSGPFTETAMYGGLDDVWSAAVPAGATVAGQNLEYYVEASDRTNTSRAPTSGAFSVPVTADETPPSITEAFASPPVLGPSAEQNVSRISFHLSEPAAVTVEVRTAGGALTRALMSGQGEDEGYVTTVWNGRTAGGAAVPNGDYRFHVRAVDGAGLPSDELTVPVEVDSGVETEPLNVILLFHANQNLNLQGDTANDVCFHGLLEVLRRHPQSKFMLHFSGPLLHDLGWFNFRHETSTLDLLRAGVADGQFEIVGSTYAQNIPYSTHMWDNDRQVEIQREVIETMVGGSPVSFWNAERCWKQALVPLIAQNGYISTWVETHILEDSGTAAPEFAVRKTRLGDDSVIVFNDDGDLIWRLDSAIDSGNTGDLLGYLGWLHSQDTYRDWAVCYAEDAEATGLWDYEGGGDPQEDWDNLDQVLTAMENTGWIRLTAMSEYLAGRYPSEDLSPIVDGQANWMVGPSQSAGYADWFDFNERAPYLTQYREFFGALRDRIRSVEALTSPGTAAANLVRHAVRVLTAHQFEFGCIGCGWWGNQDWHKAETLECAVIAAEKALDPPVGTEIEERDANGDGVLDWLISTPSDFYVVSPTGGRLLRWFDLGRGEEIVGNEIFMWGLYYLGWRDWYGGSGENDDRRYMPDAVWNAWNLAPAAAPFHREYAIRKHAMNDFLAVDGGNDTGFLDAAYAAEVGGDTLRLTTSAGGTAFDKSYIASDTILSVVYEITNTSADAHSYALRIETELAPSLLAVMDRGRGSLAYWDGADTSTVVTPATVGVTNTVTGRAVAFDYSETPGSLAGRESVHGLILSPSFSFALTPGQTKTLRVSMSAAATSVEPPPAVLPLRLRQNHPNPFNPVTTLEFDIPAAGRVELGVFDAAGRRVATVVDDRMEPGPKTATWDGTDDDGRPLASGVYFFRLAVNGKTSLSKGVLLR